MPTNNKYEDFIQLIQESHYTVWQKQQQQKTIPERIWFSTLPHYIIFKYVVFNKKIMKYAKKQKIKA